MFVREVPIASTIKEGSIDVSFNPGLYGFETLEFRTSGKSPFGTIALIYSISGNHIHSVEVLSGEIGKTRDWHKLEIIESSVFQQFKIISPMTTIFKKLRITYKEVE